MKRYKKIIYLSLGVVFLFFIVFAFYFYLFDDFIQLSPSKVPLKDWKDATSVSSSDAKSLLKIRVNELKKDSLSPSKSLSKTLPSLKEKQLNAESIVETLSIEEKAPVLVFFDNDALSTEELQSYVKSLSSDDFSINYVGQSVPFISGYITSEGYSILQQNPNVISIYIDNKEVKTHLQESSSIIQSNSIHRSLGLTGQGVGVCVIDGGVDYTHPDLGGCFGPGCKIAGGYDFCATSSMGVCLTQDSDPMDDGSHGTSVAGIIGSSNTNYKGVAPDATILAVKVNGGALSSVAAGIDWCVQNAAQYNIKVITMSLGIFASQYTPSSCPTILNIPIDQAVQNGITVIASSGNDGALSGVSYPACAPGVISVGATYDAPVGSQQWDPCFDSTTFTDDLVCFSNRQNNMLFAPGAFITSTISQFNSPCASSPKGYCKVMGTSFSAPHVAGAVALLLQQYPNLQPKQVELFLKKYGEPIYDSATALYYPRLSLKPTFSSILFPSSLVSGIPRPGSSISFNLASITNPSGFYFYLLSYGTSPGIPLGDGRVIGLNPDGLFMTSLNSPYSINLNNNIGLFDSFGSAEFSWNIASSISPNTPVYGSLIVVNPFLPFPQNIISFSPPEQIYIHGVNPVSIMNSQFPTPFAESSCVLVGSVVTCFGGNNWGFPLGNINSYDILQDNYISRTAMLPYPMTDTSCQQSNGKIYCFGGSLGNGFSNAILEYDPVLDVIIQKSASLPSARSGLSCTKTPTSSILCFGGKDSNQFFNDIFLYDPILDNLTLLSSHMPFGRSDLSCEYDPSLQKTFCFGGINGIYETDQIISYDFATSVVSVIPSKLPTPRYDLSCVYSTNSKIYCFGGSFANNELDQIVIYDTLLSTVTIDDATLPQSRRAPSCTPISNGAHYCFGGFEAPGIGQYIFYPDIVRYTV